MSADNFLDSNILIYLFDSDNLVKQQRATALIRQSLETGTACTSYQVVQEVVNVLVQKLKMTHQEVSSFLATTLVPLWCVNPSETLIKRGLDIQLRYTYSFYDSLIIAAALEAGCSTLYTEDLQHNQQIQTLTIKNPSKDT
ncbi:MAG: PIN domain-containing protein [Deinococcota bacterium]